MLNILHIVLLISYITIGVTTWILIISSVNKSNFKESLIISVIFLAVCLCWPVVVIAAVYIVTVYILNNKKCNDFIYETLDECLFEEDEEDED